MQETLARIAGSVREELETIEQSERLNDLRVRVLGRKGELTALLRTLGTLPPEERPSAGQRINAIREELEQAIEGRMRQLAAREREAKLAAESIDVTIPGKRPPLGVRNPLSITTEKLIRIFGEMGYRVAEGPEVELARYNFDMLNTPKDHPSRDAQDTFYFNEDIVLRSHTSPVQARVMEGRQPPIKIICPGRVYRADEADATHSSVFYQCEGLYVDEGITMADLKGTLDTFAEKYYGEGIRTRFRPSFFPFTEPSCEVDVLCSACRGKGCRICKGTGWIEMLGAGMVDPHVLAYCGIDPDRYTGFAFGIGIERITLLKYNIGDLRLLYENDVRYLRQFAKEGDRA